MFYAKSENKYIHEGTQFQLDGFTYPAQWLNQSTPEQKKAVGLVEVIATNKPYDPRYYWTGETLDKATLTYTGTPKDLADVKKNVASSTKQAAYALLQPTDYIEIRNMRDPAYKPDWMAWRDNVRATCDAFVVSVNACKTVDAIASLSAIEWPLDPSQPTE